MEFKSGNILIRPMAFKEAGDVVNGHAHNFDHTTYVVRGAIRIEAGERVVEKRAAEGQNWVLIRAGVTHKITALEPHTLAHCIYSHRIPQGDIVQEWDGWDKAYV